MPKKKKGSGLSRKTDGARRSAEKRKAESSEERSERLRANSQHIEQVRSNESEEARSSRLADKRIRTKLSRQNESAEATSSRLANDRIRHEMSRQNESQEATTSRVARERDRARFARRQVNENFVIANEHSAMLIDVEQFDESNVHENFQNHFAGNLRDKLCSFCKAFLFPFETSSLCCCQGKVKLPQLKVYPEKIAKYFDVANHGNSFLTKIREYNNLMALASLSCNFVGPPDANNFMPTLKIQGKLHHKIGTLIPPQNEPPVYAQMYFVDSENEFNNRRQSVFNHGLDDRILMDIQECLHAENNYVKSFKQAIEIIEQNSDLGTVATGDIVISHDKRRIPAGAHARSFNAPSTSEIAVIMVGDTSNSNNLQKSDIVVQYRESNRRLDFIPSTHRSYDPLHYVLLFPYGEDGWHRNLKMSNGKKMSENQFYSYMLQERQGEFNQILKSRKLMQQFAVDQWSKVEFDRLQWAKFHQKDIRAEKYNGLIDALASNDVNDVQRIGKKVILPPTITGSPRFWQQCFQDGMSLVREFGKPDYFITITTNPNWPEITNSLFPGEHSHDRPDLTARVFKAKYDELMCDLLKKNVIGKVAAHCASIEWQKRGLPHAHILLIMAPNDKPKNPDIVDKVVSAELPDPDKNPTLFNIVKRNNIHGPCGQDNPKSPCMDQVKKTCSKNFPKLFVEKTEMAEDKYPKYRRRAPGRGGFSFPLNHGNCVIDVDNSMIVPFNPALSLKFNCHLNVEVVHSVLAVKYIFKYITKGPDRINVRLQVPISNVNDESIGMPERPQEYPDPIVERDEIEDYHNARYISASEAFHRLYGFPIHSNKPNVVRLTCHLQGEQAILFEEGQLNQGALESPPDTMLTEYFKLNAKDELARDKLYAEIPKFYVWNKSNKIWQRRKRGSITDENEFMTDTVGRIPMIVYNEHQKELYYLRVLLYHVRGATSYEHLRTIDGVECDTNQEACKVLGLLDNDDYIEETIDEAVTICIGNRLRQVFCDVLIMCMPSDSRALWEKYKNALCEDYKRRDHTESPTEAHYNTTLLFIKSRLAREKLFMRDLNLPEPTENVDEGPREPLIIQEETNFDTNVLAERVNNLYPSLNDEQKSAFDKIVDSVVNEKGITFSLNASGGTGKTYTVNLILDKIRSLGEIAIATAVSGIAATLLHNGRTVHSRLAVPLTLDEKSICSLKKEEAKGKLLIRAKLLIIDEVTMGNRKMYECIDRSLQDLRQSKKLFGGLTVVFCGDWKQILPVVPHGSKAQILNATLKNSHLWQHVEQLHLSVNMRAVNAGDHDAEFAQYLDNLGKGNVPNVFPLGEHKVKIPDKIVSTSKKISEFCSEIFCGIEHKFNDAVWLNSRAIICPTNKAVDEVNSIVVNRLLPGELKTYFCSDKLLENEGDFSIEIINSLTPPGFPVHALSLKVNSSIMLLRNLDPANGHCNGTRYIVRNLYNHLIEAEITSGSHAGKRILIPRVPLYTTEEYPFSFIRKQFPVKLAFGVTSNKSQGQTFDEIGIYLPTPMFSHGQYYVANSRVGAFNKVKIFSLDSTYPGFTGHFTDNVVYKQVL